MECLKSVPVDKCCLVVQMPTVEEMKREVADITCEMQSVYIDNTKTSQLTSASTEQVSTSAGTGNFDNFNKNQPTGFIIETIPVHSSENYKSTFNSEKMDCDTKFGSLNQDDNQLLHKSSDSRWSAVEDVGENTEEEDEDEMDVNGLKKANKHRLNRFGSMLVDRKRANEHLMSKFTSPSISSTSTCPREEQVSEEFVINGKRYRQIYQRRVVLERKTTRDVFFLPGNNTETEHTTPNRNHYEYTSPHYDAQVSSMTSDEQPVNNSSSSPNGFIINRPGLELTVLHTRNDAQNDEPCLSPAIVVRSATGTVNNYKYTSSSACSQCKNANNTPSKLNDTTSSTVSYKPTEVKQCTTMNISDGSKISQRSRNIVRSLSNSLKRSVSTGIQRTRSFVKSLPGKSRDMESNKLDISTRNNFSKLDEDNEDNNNKNEEISEHRSKQIMGYMYKFGVWDDQQPVLDPRLPVFFDPSAKNGSHLNGTVIPTAPEWHHAEVGLENVEKFQGASVRSRTVACLQRFTQHSSASGRALHRSTYVQQTRLVRQLNRSGERKKDDAQSESEDGNKVNEQEERVSNTTPTHLFVGPGVFDSNQLPKYDIQSEDCVHPTLEDNSAKFIKCSNDRLQLLQSLCPSAAAATILLGKPVQDFYDNDDINEDNLFTPNNIDRTRVLVTANAWCPVSLRTKDPNSQLLFNSAHKHNNGNITSRSNTPKHSPSSTTLLEPTIRGGTLDGLLIYALNLLQTPMSTSHPDYLFPDVIRLTYPTFTTPEKITERLIQIYVASAPVEPGCQSIDWIDALNAADYLVTIVRDIHPSQLSATLILRLNRFARLLIYDNQLVSKELKISGEQLHDDNQISEEPHRLLADRLLENLPILSSKQTLTNHSNSASGKNKENFGCIHRKGLNGIGIMYAENDIISKKSLTISHLSSGQDNGNLVEINNRNSLQYPSLTTENGNLYFSEPQEESIHRALEFLEYDARLIAQEITQMEEEKFAEINFHELLDIQHLEKGEAHSLGRCVEHFNKITRWAKGMIFILAPNLVEKYATLNSYHQEKTSSKKSLFDNFRSCHTSSSTSSISVPQIKEKHKQNNTPYDSSSVVELTMTENAENENISKSTTLSKNLILLSYQHKDISVKKIVSLNIMLLKMCEVLKHLKQLHNFSSFLALLLAIQEVPECLLSKKSKQSVTAFSSYMKPPNFGEYRRDLEASPLPCLPYLGLIFQQLIHLHIGNPIHLPKSPTTTLSKNDRSNYENESVKKEDDSNDQTIKPLRLMSASPTSNTFDLINVWRCWKHYMVLGYFIKRKEGSSEILHSFPHNAKINRVINEFRDQFTDIAVDKAKDQLITLQRSKRNILSR